MIQAQIRIWMDMVYIGLHQSLPPIPTPPQIKKKWKNEVGQVDFQLIPFRKQFSMKLPFVGVHPLIIKTSQPGGVFY